MSNITAEMIRISEVLAAPEDDSTWVGDDLDFWTWLIHPQGGNCLTYKDLGNGLYAGAKRLLFHYTMIIGVIDDRNSYEDRYCYQTFELADAALKSWDGTGDPVGWHRHPRTSRRRTNGDPAQEYIDG